jgi:hypothetical protein
MPIDPTSSSIAPPQAFTPIQQIRFPPSPSPIPSWAQGTTTVPPPVYSVASPRPTIKSSLPSSAAGGPTGVLYGRVDGLICQDRGPLWPHVLAATVAWSPYRTTVHDDDMETAAYGSAEARTPPRFYKLEFATYDGSEDSLNWLNHCKQFFWGQRTSPSDRTWLASYHLKGSAQTWYYALEQDEGMPPWDRFAELCRLRFGPPVCGSRLTDLGRLPFVSTVQEYADRFQALLCQARDISPLQKTELFVGGLPEHLRVDVELRAPRDMQTAMYLARAFERRASALPPYQPRGARPPQRSQATDRTTPAPPTVPSAGATTAGDGNTPARPFRRLSPAEQQERRR